MRKIAVAAVLALSMLGLFANEAQAQRGYRGGYYGGGYRGGYYGGGYRGGYYNSYRPYYGGYNYYRPYYGGYGYRPYYGGYYPYYGGGVYYNSPGFFIGYNW